MRMIKMMIILIPKILKFLLWEVSKYQRTAEGRAEQANTAQEDTI